MALFKIKKGLKANLPTTYVEGYCYFTTDDGKFYIDTSNAAAGRVVLNAEKADKLATARTISLTGDVTGSVSFDGSANASITATVANDSHSHSNYALAKQNCSNKDFDTLTTTGFYYGYTGMTNAAVQAISVLEVLNYSGDWIVQRQTVIGESPVTYERTRYSGTTWSPWHRIYTTVDKPTLSDIGAAASSHNHSASEITSGTIAAARLPAATTSAQGAMTAAMVTKLNGIAEGANNYSLPTASSSTLGGVKIGTGIAISSGVISNSGVRSIATGSTNGTISVNTNGTSAEVAVKGLGSAAYTASTAYAPASHSHNYLTGWSDSRNVTTTPNDYNSQFKVVGIKTPTGSGTLDGSSYSTLVGIRGWSDSSGGNSHELAFTGSGSLYRRHGSTTSWGNWIQILDSSNYTSYCAQASHSHSYLPLSGGTMTGALTTKQLSISENSLYINKGNYPAIRFNMNDGSTRLGTIQINAASNGSYATSLSLEVQKNSSTAYSATLSASDGTWNATKVTGAVWNDYAEYRDQLETIEPGYIVYSEDDGKLRLTTKKLQKFEGVVSDTFGFAIGETDNCKTPLAVSGRVLVYANPEDEFHSGDSVCAGPNGLAYRMTREEIMMYPDRIVGVVSEIPTYETWGTGNVAVNGRIWIKVK